MARSQVRQNSIGYTQTTQLFQATLAELVKAKYTFTILRDPYSRIYSCYLDIDVNLPRVYHQFEIAVAG